MVKKALRITIFFSTVRDKHTPFKSLLGFSQILTAHQAPIKVRTWLVAALAKPARLYPPSITETNFPPACSRAMLNNTRVRSAKSSSVSSNCPNGSPSRESNPAETKTNSGLKRFAAFTRRSSNAPNISFRPEPAGNGLFWIHPNPRPVPLSDESPVPGYKGC